ncbi:50S ribosome-binding GTPase [Oryctes borbonicus]|uniref:50S ribosome-binding GTPase n=1 Tax=Oryctes borbonicus TaxID=1629725 RepID=A0A0T6B758_9SCAR|nr:50S ribosome-binding GTPase [Oryctes borbonicus]
MQRKQALIQSQGLLSRTYIKWKDQVTDALMNFESLFNFENIDDSNNEETQKNISNIIKQIHTEITNHLNDGKRGQLLRSGVKTAIIGEPNVGKSSLYNFLCKKKAAIVTPYPGTTRDTLEYYIDLFGYPVILYDTCGIRYRDVNLIEAAGVQITLDTIKSSELLLLVIDAEKYHVWLNNTEKGNLLCYVKDYIINELQVPDIINRGATNLLYLFKKRCLIVINKIDKIQIPMEDDEDVSCISVTTNAGLEEFLNNINKKLKDM